MKNEWDVVRKFEEEIAEFGGSKYAVAMESCTFALFLCCYYLQVKEVTIPEHTYPGVPCGIIHAGGTVKFEKSHWVGTYQLKPYPIWDSAKRFRERMYIKDSYYCLSFHAKKRIPIGRGGMVLTNDKHFVKWARMAIRDGKEEGKPFHKQNFTVLGWNAYMSPEQAARGLQLFHAFKHYANRDETDLVEVPNYPDLSKMEIYR